jgi:GNAT superfamily N-acetyltransferase
MSRGELRAARPADRDALNALIARSARDLSRGWYTEAETDGLIRYVFGVDTQLIADGTYYLVEQGGTIVACGGWSARQTLFGGDQAKGAEDERLNPEVDAARIRAFFVDPRAARQGLGRRLLRHCESEARRAGFRTCELMATLPGEPFYRAEGYRALEAVSHPLPDGRHIRFIRMERTIMPDRLPEPWLRGPVAGIPPLLQPAAHAFLLSLEDAERAAADLRDADLWTRPGGAASAGYHLLHLSGSTDRLLSYARGEPLSAEQLGALAAEQAPHPGRSVADLMAAWRETVRRALAQLADTREETLGEGRAVGRARLPATVLGLLFHAAEHSQRHAGQLATTVKVLSANRQSPIASSQGPGAREPGT